MTTFWDELPKPFFALAPMEAVTDVVFRHVVTRAGAPDVYYSEFTNATGWVHAGDKATGGRLIKTDDEHPIIAQLWGSEPDAIAALSVHCAKLGYDGIDLNMGCPDASAVKAGGGAAMIRTPDLAHECIAAARSSGLPVSVKTRLGYSSIDEWHEWLGGLLQHDLAALTVHLRTKKEMSKVPAHHELIPYIRILRDEVAPQTRLIINGDIMNRVQGEELARTYGIDGVMIGRGIFHDPFVFRRCTERSELWSRDEEQAKGRAHVEILVDLLRYHLDLYDEYQPSLHRPYETLKRFFKIYINSFESAAELREQLMHTTSTNEARQVLHTFFSDSKKI